MSNFSNIGFHITSEQELYKLAENIYGIGKIEEAHHGKYIVYSDSSGAELWMQVDKNNSLIGMNPHYNGYSKRLVCLTKIIQRPDSILDGAFHCWSNPIEINNPDSGEYPFVFDLPNAKTIGEIKFPYNFEIQLSAFAQKITLYSSEDEFNSKQTSDVKFATQSFIPMGLFKPEGESTEPPEALGMFTGIIKEFDIKVNSFTRNHFYWFLVNTLGGEIDIVADPILIIDKPKLNGVIQGQFWLSGKLYYQPYITKENNKGFFKKLFS
ncbi:MAG: hypothetical protein IPM56_01395 [Ignavibacteriales bacterium]|nr:MAG: hypothetical protein IPM56_01395 [Ignavibacteriales bacterium]